MFNFTPNLRSELIEIRELKADDFEELYAVASDPELWEQHPVANRYQREVFEKFFAEALANHALIIIDAQTQKIIGSTRYYHYDPSKNEVAIGYTFLARQYWGGHYNAELKKLMLDHAFYFASKVIFHVGEKNLRSQKAMLKLGAKFIGTEMKEWPDRLPQLSFVYMMQKEASLQLSKMGGSDPSAQAAPRHKRV